MSTPVLERRYRPRGACAALLRDRSDEVLLSGPAGTGKSRACLEKLHRMCMLNPGMRALIARKTAVSLTSTALVTFREHVARESLVTGEMQWYGGSQQEPAQYRYDNGSAIVVGGMDKPTKIMSSEYDVAYVQEAIELDEQDWEAITTRLRNGKVSFQQLIADTNPAHPTHWLKLRADTGRVHLHESRHADNPVLYGPDGAVTERGAAYMAKLDALTGVRRARLRDGLWVAAENLVYDEWDPAVHLVNRFDIPSTWMRWWSVDFGYTNPFVCQCWAEDPDGRLYLEWEIYHTRRLVEDHARKILSLVRIDGQWTVPRPRAIICDHDAEDRATLERHLGLSTVAAKKTVSDGIQEVAGRLKRAGDGKPRLMLLRDARVERDQALADAGKPTCTAEEAVSYVWDTANGRKVKEQPLKDDDHGMDAMRYMAAERAVRRGPGVRVLRW